MTRNWLVTSFTPFNGRAENNSQNVMRELMKLAEAHESATIRKINEELGEPVWPLKFYEMLLPTEYDSSFKVLISEIEKLKQAGVELEGILSLGEGKTDLKIETQANNLDHAPELKDNKGIVRTNQKIYPELADLIPFHFPLKEVFSGFYPEFLEYVKSPSPGTFVCNNLCARATVELEKLFGKKRPYFGFIHVPRADLKALFSPQKCAKVIMGCFESIAKERKATSEK